MTRLIDESARLLELVALLTVAAAYTLLSGAAAIDVPSQIYLTVAWLLLLLALSWRQSQGMHPVFFFLAFLLLFQGGRLLVYCLHASGLDPMRIELGGSFDVAPVAQRTSLLALVISSLAIYFPMRLFDSQVRHEPPASLDLTPYLLAIFLLTLPFHAWKNYEYLAYVRSHGDYLAIFQSSEHLQQVGLLARSLSQICTAAFIAYFCYEQPRLRLVFVTLAYLSISVVELLIGLRGKVLLFGLGLLFLWKLKRGTRFRMHTLAVVAITVAIVAQATANFRENKDQSINLADVPAAFLVSQGASLDVTETMIAYRSQFIRNRWSYLTHLWAGSSQTQSDTPRGRVMEDDLSIFLDPVGFASGYGTGGSFLAEGFLYGGILGLAIESFSVGLMLVFLAKNFRGVATPYVWTLMLVLLYLPRQNLLQALSGSVPGLSAIALVILFSQMCVWLIAVNRSAAAA